MKAKNLMIGDWVDVVNINHKVEELSDEIIDLGYEKTKRTIKISAINLTGIHYDCEEYGPIFVPIEDLQPIPFTPEILEKNEFKKDLEHNFIYWRPDCRKFCIVKELDTWYFAFRVLGETVDKNSGYICISECNYVHKLQHKLKDLKIEREIIL